MSETGSRALCTWPQADVSAWPAPDVPFPVTVPYRPQPGLARLGSPVHGRRDGRVLDADRGAPAALRAKHARLQAHLSRCVALAPGLREDPAAVWRRVCAAANAIVDAQPRPAPPGAGCVPLERVGDALHAGLAGWAMPADADAPFALRALRADAAPVLDWIAARPAAERPLHALALALQEDLAFVESDSPRTPARASLLHVCWPSGWDPARKVGLDFAAIHAPVADADALRAASLPLSRALVAQGPFVRFVWTVAPDGAWSRHPDDAPAAADGEPWFRCERQVSLPLPTWPGAPDGGCGVFLIRLHVAPLASVADTAERRATLRDALASMSPATLAYKGLAERRAALLARLEPGSGGPGPPR